MERSTRVIRDIKRDDDWNARNGQSLSGSVKLLWSWGWEWDFSRVDREFHVNCILDRRRFVSYRWELYARNRVCAPSGSDAAVRRSDGFVCEGYDAIDSHGAFDTWSQWIVLVCTQNNELFVGAFFKVLFVLYFISYRRVLSLDVDRPFRVKERHYLYR